MANQVSCTDAGWLPVCLEAVAEDGYCIVTDVVPEPMLAEARTRLRAVQQSILEDIGPERLERAGERGVLRLMMRYDPFFCEFLQLEPVLQVVDGVLGDTSILHLQNGFILPPRPPGADEIFQERMHRDFPRLFNGFVASVNTLIAIDAFTEANGATRVLPGTHQRPVTDDELLAEPIVAECPPGGMIVFDSTLMHGAGSNQSEGDRMGINHQFTRSYLKQQIDYVRALGDEAVLAQPARTQQLLGWYTRVVTSLDEYYQPAERRLYRGGQG